MQTVAARLGATTMALYWYIASKSELLDAMVEAALGTPPALDAAARLARQVRHLGTREF